MNVSLIRVGSCERMEVNVKTRKVKMSELKWGGIYGS